MNVFKKYLLNLIVYVLKNILFFGGWIYHLNLLNSLQFTGQGVGISKGGEDADELSSNDLNLVPLSTYHPDMRVWTILKIPYEITTFDWGPGWQKETKSPRKVDQNQDFKDTKPAQSIVFSNSSILKIWEEPVGYQKLLLNA